MSDTAQARPCHPGQGKFVAGGIIIAACVAALLYGATKMMSLDFFDSVSRFNERIDSCEGKTVRVRGIVRAGSVSHDAQSLDTQFILTDKDASLRVSYRGVLPGSFEPGSDIVVQGAYDSGRKLLVANQLMFKCPSKYESKRGVY